MRQPALGRGPWRRERGWHGERCRHSAATAAAGTRHAGTSGSGDVGRDGGAGRARRCRRRSARWPAPLACHRPCVSVAWTAPPGASITTDSGVWNQLRQGWGGRWDSNPRRPESQSGALPTELRPPSSRQETLNSTRQVAISPSGRSSDGAPGRTRTCNRRLRRPVLYPVELRALDRPRLDSRISPYRPGPGHRLRSVVGAEGFEPPTLCSQSRCATRLRHAPPASEPHGTRNLKDRPPARQTSWPPPARTVRECTVLASLRAAGDGAWRRN